MPMVRRACLVLLVISAAACHSSPTAPSTSSIAVTGTVPSVGQTSQLDAKATLSNGTSQDVTAQATWSSSNTAIATVTAGGLLKVLALGGAQVTATYQGVSGNLAVSLSVTSVTVSGPTTLTLGQQYQFTATENFSNSTSQNVTTQATWSWSSGGIPPFNITQGFVTPLIVLRVSDNVTISASYQGVTGQTSPISNVLLCSLTQMTGSPNFAPDPSGLGGIFVNPQRGGSFIVSVQGPASCGWTTLAVDNPGGPSTPSSYTTVTSGGNGAGNGVISFSVSSTCPTGLQTGLLIQPSAAANLPLNLQAQMISMGAALLTGCQ
jgi:trimeric autotransporter adhesin